MIDEFPDLLLGEFSCFAFPAGTTVAVQVYENITQGHRIFGYGILAGIEPVIWQSMPAQAAS